MSLLCPTPPSIPLPPIPGFPPSPPSFALPILVIPQMTQTCFLDLF